MNNINRRGFLASACVACTSSFAQTRSSFLTVDGISGVNVSVTNGGLNNLITLNSGAFFTYNSVNYQTSDVFGFWALSDDDDLTASGTTQSGWGYDASNSDPGGIAGWKTNPNSGITPPSSIQLNFASLSTSKVERYGFHVRLASGTFPGTNGNTGYITTNAVPEPATLAALGLGVAAMIRRRRQK